MYGHHIPQHQVVRAIRRATHRSTIWNVRIVPVLVGDVGQRRVGLEGQVDEACFGIGEASHTNYSPFL